MAESRRRPCSPPVPGPSGPPEEDEEADQPRPPPLRDQQGAGPRALPRRQATAASVTQPQPQVQPVSSPLDLPELVLDGEVDEEDEEDEDEEEDEEDEENVASIVGEGSRGVVGPPSASAQSPTPVGAAARKARSVENPLLFNLLNP